MARSKFTLGQKVLVSAENKKCYRNNESVRENFPLAAAASGIIVGSRNYPTGPVIFSNDRCLFTQTGTVHCFLIAVSLSKAFVAAEENFIETVP